MTTNVASTPSLRSMNALSSYWLGQIVLDRATISYRGNLQLPIVLRHVEISSRAHHLWLLFLFRDHLRSVFTSVYDATVENTNVSVACYLTKQILVIRKGKAALNAPSFQSVRRRRIPRPGQLEHPELGFRLSLDGQNPLYLWRIS